jgi:8-oxo-dGTP pyrophosphatase MutT (NUDIX family)/ribosomal protein S18 acetylase RimI-like enzyme
MTNVQIFEAKEKADFEEGKILIDEYATYLEENRIPDPVDFVQDINSYPKHYMPPDGAVLIARVNDQLAGCVSVRNFEPKICELKRLFVRESFRQLKIGKQLCFAIIEKAIELGFKKMRLDTVPEMVAAIGLYESLGFYRIKAYFQTDVEDTVFMELNLDNYNSENIEIDDSWYTRSGGTDRISAGGVVCRIVNGEILVAIVSERGLPDPVLPKGGVEDGETLEQAARREIEEEAGLTDLKFIKALGVCERHDLRKKRWIKTHLFLCSTEQETGIPTDSDHHFGLTWAPIGKLPRMFWPEQRELIESNREQIEMLLS